jgi:hypothetical protein
MVMRVPMHLGDCPSGDVNGVGGEHGTHCRLYPISAIVRQIATLLCRWWDMLMVGSGQGATEYPHDHGYRSNLIGQVDPISGDFFSQGAPVL